MTSGTLPRGSRLPPIIQTIWWLSRPLSFMRRCRDRYGDNFSVRFLGFKRPMVLISDPEAIRALYSEREHGLPPGRTITLQPILGSSSLLLLEGAEHLSRRRLMLPPFHGERMRSYEQLMRQITEAEVQRWPIGTAFPLHPRMQAITLEVILHAVFGLQGDRERAARRSEELRRLLGQLLQATASTGIQLRVLLAGRAGNRDPLADVNHLCRQIDDLLFAEIAERRSEPDLQEREDILSLLLLARSDDGEGLSDQELRDQLMTLLLAGHETTATALAWTFDELLHNPQPLASLTAEIERAETETEGGQRYLKAVIDESLRLRPVVPLAGRRLAKELACDGLRLAAGSDVTPAIWLTHMRADLYPQPELFRPERFLDSPPSTYGWIPFGGGVRRCLGASFAEMELRIVLATVLRMADLQAASPKSERVTRRNVTFAPRNGTRVILRAVRATGPPGSTAAAQMPDLAAH